MHKKVRKTFELTTNSALIRILLHVIVKKWEKINRSPKNVFGVLLKFCLIHSIKLKKINTFLKELNEYLKW